MREARRADLPSIVATYVRSWRAAYAGSLSEDELATLADQRGRSFDWSRGMDDPDAAVLVGVDASGAIVGVVQADERLPSPRDLPEVTMLYVDPPAWGSGAGAVLLAAVVDWLAGRGHRGARLRVVDHHRRARRFYEREGWVLDPDLPPVRTPLGQLVSYRRSLERPAPDR